MKHVVERVSDTDVFSGQTALSAKQHGEDLLAVNYADGLSSQIEAMQSIIDNANDALEYVRKQRESLPGNQLDAVSSAAIRIADVGATVLLPFPLAAGKATIRRHGSVGSRHTPESDRTHLVSWRYQAAVQLPEVSTEH